MSNRSWAHRAVPAVLVAVAIAIAMTLAAAGPAEAEVRRGALVRIPFGATDGTLTPYTFTQGYGLVTLVYDTLLWRDARGVPRPWLARSVRTSADGRRLTVKLAERARWHDGVALTADDVAFTFEHLRRFRHPRFTPQLRELAGVTVTGRHSLVFELRRPSAGFVDQPLADVPILPRHIWAPLEVGEIPPGLPVGSGPYRLVRYRPGRGYTFAANARYFRGPPAVRRIEVPVMGDQRGVTRALENDRVDIVRLVSIEGSTGALESRRLAVARGTGYLGAMLMFNLRRAPFHDPRMRRAVARALELPRIARAVAGSSNRIEPALQGAIHPQSRWATRERLHAPDLPAARAVLARGGGRRLRVLADRSDAVIAAAGRQVVDALRRAGARATLVLRPARAFDRAIGADGARANFELAVATLTPLASYDPDGLRAVFGIDGSLNYSGYRSDAFERLADRVTTTTPPDARRAAVAAELRLLARDLPAVPLFFDTPSFLYRRSAWDGWVYVAGTGVLDKRSFMAPAATRERASATAVPATIDTAGTGALGYVALALVGLALCIVVVGSLRSGP